MIILSELYLFRLITLVSELSALEEGSILSLSQMCRNLAGFDLREGSAVDSLLGKKSQLWDTWSGCLLELEDSRSRKE